MLSVKYGSVKCPASNGHVFHLDREISTDDADLILATLHEHGMTTKDVTAVEIDDATTRVQRKMRIDDERYFITRLSNGDWEVAKCWSIQPNPALLRASIVGPSIVAKQS